MSLVIASRYVSVCVLRPHVVCFYGHFGCQNCDCLQWKLIFMGIHGWHAHTNTHTNTHTRARAHTHTDVCVYMNCHTRQVSTLSAVASVLLLGNTCVYVIKHTAGIHYSWPHLAGPECCGGRFPTKPAAETVQAGK